MPPDVFLMLSWSGVSFIAALVYLVTPEPPVPAPIDDPRLYVAFCDPPLRRRPPPLPLRGCRVRVTSPATRQVLTLIPSGAEWEMTLDLVPIADSPASTMNGQRVGGPATDIRWHGKAALLKPTRHQWRQKPGRA